MSQRFTAAATRFLARRSPRRGFLAKTAVVGSALAVTPKAFITRPGTAYAQVCNCSGSDCGCSSLCCDGYTEFCCTIYGTNGCPPGSLYGGWWRVSGSNYCGGNNRYYLDCHNPCNGCSCGANGICSGSCNGTACGCALGSCRNRKAGCTHFRYGQCNQQIDCLGPIVCRVITCTPPWQLEPTCSTSVRTDDATRNHHRACLTSSGNVPIGELDSVDADEPGTIRVQGWAIDPDVVDPIVVNIHVNGDVVATITADRPRIDIGTAFRSYGENHGFDYSFPSTIGTKEVCVYAANADGGSATLLGCSRVRVTAGTATGVIESARSRRDGGVRVRGWAVLEGSAEPVDVDLVVDGEMVKTVTADRAREDLADTLGELGVDHGFATTVRRGAGAQQICASVVDPETDERIELGCMVVEAPVTEAPIGSLDRVRGRTEDIRVVGWAFDPDGGDVEVAVFLDGVELARGVASQPRPDLTAVYPTADAAGGFDIKLPAAPGEHNVCVYTFGSDGAQGPLLGCSTVTVG